MNKHSVVVDPAVKQNCLADLSLGLFIASISLNVYHMYIPYETVSYTGDAQQLLPLSHRFFPLKNCRKNGHQIRFIITIKFHNTVLGKKSNYKCL